MRNFQNTSKTRKRSFISAFSICTTVLLSEFKETNQLLFPLESSDKFSDDFRGNRSKLIHLNSLSIRSKIWRRSLTFAELKHPIYSTDTRFKLSVHEAFL